MFRMSYSGKTRILLDTTYLLPIVRVDAEEMEEIMVVLRRLRDRGVIVVYYMWLITFGMVC